ncbi:glycosyltransferase involved in cell wall biosynthesis [Actinoalloteichus hymeniacidonis]|nr:glycosyltransferase [Actinoalloteichus hymeniacidonis]MBB5906911.1 glycosyltransferase involved in cell wall biosynthesis [Actinoalloteichus hymeniacidonis]
MDLVNARTLGQDTSSTVSVVIPAHNEETTIEHVVSEAFRSLDILDVQGEVLVSASGCTDDTAVAAQHAGATVVTAPIGKGAAITDGVAHARGDIICLVDGDLKYFGDPPLVALLVDPILRGISDACVSDLYWRPLYPQMWLHGFFAPIAGLLFPEMLARVGTTPWSGQRAARRNLWPESLPADFTADIALLLHWNRHAKTLRSVLADDWVNPQRPKHDLMSQELDVLIAHAISENRIDADAAPKIRNWYESTHKEMATYKPDVDDPHEFERRILSRSIIALHQHLELPGALPRG